MKYGVYLKKWPIRLSAFLLILVLSLAWLSFLFRPTNHFIKNILGYYAENNDTIDIAMIGGSSTYVFWMPLQAYEKQGIVSYNFAGDAMSPALIKNCIIECSKSQNPKLFVIDVRSFINRENISDYYTEAYVRYYTDCFFYSKNRIDMINYAAKYEKIDVDESCFFDLIKYHSLWKSLNENSFKWSFNCKKDLCKGFTLKSEYQPVNQMDYSMVKASQKLSSENEKILTELLEYCRTNKLNCLFTVNPYRVENESSKMNYNYIDERVGEYGYKFINSNDYYKEMNIDFFKDYYDVNHVNVFGAEKYTDFLANYIKQEYVIPDRRGDSSYSTWNDDCETWDKELAECKADTSVLIYTFIENFEKQNSVG